MTPNITVRTCKNGYQLTVDGRDYIYFSAVKLITGIAYHAVYGSTKDADVNEYAEALLSKSGIADKFKKEIHELQLRLRYFKQQNAELRKKLKTYNK